MDVPSSEAEGLQPRVNRQVVFAGPGDVRLEMVPVLAPDALEVESGKKCGREADGELLSGAIAGRLQRVSPVHHSDRLSTLCRRAWCQRRPGAFGVAS